MGKVANTGTRIWLNQFDLSGFLTAANLNLKQETIPVATFSDTGPRRLVGNYDHNDDLNGLFDGTDDLVDEIIHALLESASDHYLAKMFGANSEGSVVYESIVALTGKPLTGAVGGAVLLNHAYAGRNGLYRGTILRNATISANGNGTGRNMGASTAGQTFGVVFRVFSGTFTSFDLTLEESQNDGGGDPYATITGLTNSFAAAGVAYKSTIAATETWKRVAISNWIGTDAVIGVTAGILAGT